MLSLFAKAALCLLVLLYTYLGTFKIPSDVAAFYNDLVAHALGYIVLMCVAAFAFPDKKVWLKVALACFVYSLLIECIQYFLPYRFLSLLDMMANGAGVCVGYCLAYLLWPVMRRMYQLPAQEGL